MSRPARLAVLLVLLAAPLPATARAQEGAGAHVRPRVARIEDLPEHVFDLAGSPAELLAAPERLRVPTEAALETVQEDLAGSDFASDGVRQELVRWRFLLELSLGRDEDALSSLAEVRALEDEEAERRTAFLLEEAWLRARRDAGRRASAQALRPSVEERLSELVSRLSWDVCHNELEHCRTRVQIASDAYEAVRLDRLEKTIGRQGGADLAAVVDLAALDVERRIVLPFQDLFVSVTTRFLEGTAPREDVWSGRAVDLDGAEGGTPVVVGVWDTGVDDSLFSGRWWTNEAETPNGIDDDGNGFVDDVHGIAFTPDLERTPELLYPASGPELEEARRWAGPLQELAAGVDDEETQALRRHLQELDPQRWEALMDGVQLYGMHCHGTHVAGIALTGNPYARLVTCRVGMHHSEEGTPMSPEWARSFVASCSATVDWLRAAGARVVNVSWSWSLSEITRNLEVRGVGGDAEARAALAGEIHAILARGMRDALGGADDVLFVCAAGNTGEEVGREGALPAGLELPNLLVVGAVDGAGAVTSFTSFGPEVDVFADGARIESVIPGGAHLRLSGTSMATPQVTNLAAKLLALRPALSPREVSDLVVRGGERVSRDGRELVLLDPARSLELLHEG